MKLWYQLTVSETEQYFDVDVNTGLSQPTVLKRLEKFGKNENSLLSPTMSRIYQANVRRQGRLASISASYLVPGDVVLLEPGNRVPADLRLFNVNKLFIDEAAFTGNNLPSAKNTFAVAKAVDLSEQKCLAFAGSFVLSGSGKGIVVANGQRVVAQKIIGKNRRLKIGLRLRLTIKQLQKHGVIVNHPLSLKGLKSINMVFIDADLAPKDVAEIIRQVQLHKKVPCKFLVNESKFKILKQNFGDLKACQINELAGTSEKIMQTVVNCSFIVGDYADTIGKLLAILKKRGTKMLWLTDGRIAKPTMQAADISLVIGRMARDDVIHHADLIAPLSDVHILSSILYNKN